MKQFFRICVTLAGVPALTKRKCESSNPVTGLEWPRGFQEVNPLPSLTLQSARGLDVPCRPKRSCPLR